MDLQKLLKTGGVAVLKAKINGRERQDYKAPANWRHCKRRIDTCLDIQCHASFNLSAGPMINHDIVIVAMYNVMIAHIQ